MTQDRDEGRDRNRYSRLGEDGEGCIVGPTGAVILSPTSPEYRRLLKEARERAKDESEQNDS